MKSTFPLLTLALASTFLMAGRTSAQSMPGPYGPAPMAAPPGAYGAEPFAGSAYPYYTAAGPANFLSPAGYGNLPPQGFGPGQGAYAGAYPAPMAPMAPDASYAAMGYGPSPAMAYGPQTAMPAAYNAPPYGAPGPGPGYGAPGYGAPGYSPGAYAGYEGAALSGQSVMAGAPNASPMPAGPDQGYVDGGAGCDGCTTGCDACHEPCWHFPIHASLEYLYWTRSGQNLPPLVTTGPANGNFNDVGEIGRPGTRVLFGGEEEDTSATNGLRATVGFWADCTHEVGLWARYWTLDEDEQAFSQVSGGDPVLAIPFRNFNLNPANPPEDALIVAFPGLLSGSVNVASSSEIWSAEGYATVLLHRGCGWRIDVLGGYHQMRIEQGISLNTVSTVLPNLPPNAPPLAPSGTRFEISDQFNTRNDFKGGELGLICEVKQGCYSAKVLFKGSLGNMEQQISASGRTTIFSPPPFNEVVVRNSGLFAQGSNSGTFTRDQTVAIPEFGVTVGYDLTQHWKLIGGYTLIYVSDVLQPGEQFDRIVDRTQADPTQNPGVPFSTTDLWLSGVSAGIEFRY